MVAGRYVLLFMYQFSTDFKKEGGSQLDFIFNKC